MGKADFTRSGRMLSAIKKCPLGHICVWNANLCTKSKGKIWYGDLDLTADEPELIALAKLQNEDVFVMREMDARFKTEKDIQYSKAVAVFQSDGVVIILETP